MFKVILSNASVSKGFEGADAVQYRRNEDGEVSIASFSVFTSVYDSRAENSQRYISVPVRAFGKTAARIQNMKVDAFSGLNIDGHLDDNCWVDREGKKHHSLYVAVDGIEYSGGRKKESAGNGENGDSAQAEDNNGENPDISAFDELPF